MKVEIWSDVVCPWCYIGKRRFEAALANFKHQDQVEIHWKSYQLNPKAASTSKETLNEMLASKYGMSLEKAIEANERVSSLAAEEGLDYHLDRAHPANTFDAHRLIHLAATHGSEGAMKERLLQAYFTEGQAIGEKQTLVALAVEVGLDAEEVDAALASDAYTDEVIADEQEARDLGITGVPFFVIDNKYGISGAQPRALFQKAFEQIWTETHPLISSEIGEQGAESCNDETCAIE